MAERMVGNMEGRRWRLGVERVKHNSLVGTVPILWEEERRNGMNNETANYFTVKWTQPIPSHNSDT